MLKMLRFYRCNRNAAVDLYIGKFKPNSVFSIILFLFCCKQIMSFILFGIYEKS